MFCTVVKLEYERIGRCAIERTLVGIDGWEVGRKGEASDIDRADGVDRHTQPFVVVAPTEKGTQQWRVAGRVEAHHKRITAREVGDFVAYTLALRDDSATKAVHFARIHADGVFPR